MKHCQRSIVVISDLVEGCPARTNGLSTFNEQRRQWLSRKNGTIYLSGQALKQARESLVVAGGYLERFPLACVKAGLVDRAEIWHHWRADGVGPERSDGPLLTRRAFAMDTPAAPFASEDMLAHIAVFGPPTILLVLGLGVDTSILEACKSSIKIYNSIDAPALRIPSEVSSHFDLILTGATSQSSEVLAQHPGMPTEVMPIGPEFASPETFFPLDQSKDYDVIYVAAAQSYKRHDILFDALAKLPRHIRTLCVFGYGEMADSIRRRAAEGGLNVDFIGPPGVSFAEVNALMGRARIGVVCGEQDGAPAILTEYMLAGIPVLANENLCCGLQYINAKTGMTASASQFDRGITALLENAERLRPRDEVLARWAWPHTIQRLTGILASITGNALHQA